MTKLSSFEKRIKRRVIGPEHTFFAVCTPGLENICMTEILATGILKKDIRRLHGGIEFDTKLAKAIELNLVLGTPSRIIMRIGNFKADSFGKLEKKINAIDWILYLKKGCPIQFKVTTKKSRLYHSDAIAQRCQTIVSSHIGQHQNPATNNAQADSPSTDASLQTIYIRADNDQFTISLDTSGEILFKRSIKQKVTHAPLRENLAFAMLSWAGFSKDDILIDPMCGSGTFSIEAAMIKSNLCPGFFRSFAFEHWPAFSPKAFAHFKKQRQKNVDINPKKQIFASDADDDAIAAIKQNISDYPFNPMIDIGLKDFFSIDPTKLSSQKGVIMLNPPYGRRIGSKSATPAFFLEIAKKLTADFKGWRIGILLPDKDCTKALGLPLNFKPISHGGLDLFAGIGMI